MRKSLVFVLTLLSAASVLGETAVSEPLSARGAGWQSAPVSATDGRDFLLAWTDMRRGQAAIYATRVTANGEVLDPGGILVSATGRAGYALDLAWTGSSYVIVWSGPSGSEFRRLGRDGAFIDPSPRTIFESYTVSPRVTVADRTIIVAATSWQYGTQIATIDEGGFVRKTGEIRSIGMIDLACGTSDCWAIGLYGSSIAGRRLGRDGTVLDDANRFFASDAGNVAIEANGDRFLLVWRDARRLWARELDAEPFLITETKKAQLFASTVAPSGRSFIVMWTQEHERERIVANAARTPRVELHARVIGNDEDVLIPAPEITRYQRPAVASNGATHIAAWIEAAGFGKIAAGVSGDLQSLAPIAVTRTATEQTDEQMIDCGDHLLVTWSEDIEGNGAFAVFARRFRYGGEAIDAAPIRVAPSTFTQRNPAAAFDGTSYFIAWSENDAVYARTLNGGEVMKLSDNGDAPSVTATDRGFAVLHRIRGVDGVPHLALTSVNKGSLLRTDVDRWSHGAHGVAWNGAEIVAVWGSSDYRILGARFTADGARLDSEAFLVGRGVNLTEDPSVVCAAGECAATWWELNAGAQNARIVGGSALLVNEPFRDFTDYRQPPAERFDPFVLRTGNAFRFFASDGIGVLYERTLRNATASPERRVYQQPTRIESRGSIVDTPNGLMRVYARPVDEPGYGGARRLFLTRLSH